MMRRCACIVLLEYRDRNSIPAIEETVASLCQLGEFGTDPHEIKGRIDEMLHSGSRYRNLEKHLGYGAVLALGSETPETV